MVPVMAATYTRRCSFVHRLPSRRTQPFVDVIASGTMISQVSIPMRMYLCLRISCHMSPQAKNQSTADHIDRCTHA